MSTTLATPARDEEHERVLSAVFDLSPSQSSVLSCLIRAHIVSSAELLNFTGVKSLVKIVVSHTRKKLKEHGFDIKSKPGVGYWIDPEEKHSIEKMVAKFLKS
jgi:DNA-binding response OmpR family regulator